MSTCSILVSRRDRSPDLQNIPLLITAAPYASWITFLLADRARLQREWRWVGCHQNGGKGGQNWTRFLLPSIRTAWAILHSHAKGQESGLEIEPDLVTPRRRMMLPRALSSKDHSFSCSPNCRLGMGPSCLSLHAMTHHHTWKTCAPWGSCLLATVPPPTHAESSTILPVLFQDHWCLWH